MDCSQDLTSLTFPFPTNDEDCPASPICEHIGNLRKSCTAGGPLKIGASDVCYPSIVILLGRLAGFGMEPPPQSKRFEDFESQDKPASD